MNNLLNKYNNHIRNKSLDDSELGIPIGSPFSNISKEKSWRSANNLYDIDVNNYRSPDNKLTKRSPLKSMDDFSISISESINENIDELDELEDTSEIEKKKRFDFNRLYIDNLIGFFYYIILIAYAFS